MLSVVCLFYKKLQIFLSFIILGKGRKALRVGTLPTVNLPERSHEMKDVLPRRPLTIC